MKPTDSSLTDATLTDLRERVEVDFLARFGRQPSVIVAAPGRVNLIGEHIDYNDGFVLPLALERYVLIAADSRDGESTDRTICLHSQQLATTASIRVAGDIRPGSNDWTSYVSGVVAGFINLGVDIPAMDAVVGSTVPVGSGLSSSAALEVATATLIEHMTNHPLGLAQKALLCQKAEHDFAGVPCGIMDQFSSVFGQSNELMLIDCCTQSIEAVPFHAGDVSVLITNSNVKHELNGSEYASRRAECDSALQKIGKNSWRNVSLNDLERALKVLTEVELRRGRHVVNEISRTIQAADAFRQNDWFAAGELMYASHNSLRDEFEVSCSELDTLVEIAREIGSSGGVIGSRMTGGGFGGCTVSLVANDRLDSVIDILSLRYESETDIKPHCFSSRPAPGAHVLKG